MAGSFACTAGKRGDSKGKKSWRVLRGGVADLHLRAEISERAAERYLDALAGADEQSTLQELPDRLGQPKQWKGGECAPGIHSEEIVRCWRQFAAGNSC
jgi:hypothetical protein